MNLWNRKKPLPFLANTLWLKIFSYLSIEDLWNVARLNKQWGDFSENNPLWKNYGFFNKTQFKQLLKNAQSVEKSSLLGTQVTIYLLGNPVTKNNIFWLHKENEVSMSALFSGLLPDKRYIWIDKVSVQLINPQSQPNQLYGSDDNPHVYLICAENEDELRNYIAKENTFENENTLCLYTIPAGKVGQLHDTKSSILLRKEDDTMATFFKRLLEKIHHLAHLRDKPSAPKGSRCAIM